MAASTDFQAPPKTPRSSGRFFQRCWFRVIFFTCLLGVCLVAGMVAAGLFFIETQPAQAFIQKQVNKAIPGTLSWEQFRLGLREGRVQISGIHLKDASGKEVAGISLVEARVDWSALTRHKIELNQILIDKPVLDIGMSAQGEVDILSALVSDTGAASDTGASDAAKFAGVDFWVREFKVNQARIKVTAAQFNTDLADLSVEVTGFKLSELCASAKVTLAGGHLGFGEMDLALESFDLQARIDKDKVSDIDINARMPGIGFNANGSVAGLLGTVTPDLTATFNVETPLAAKTLGLPEDLVQGNGRINLTITGGLDNPRAVARFEFGRGSINNTAISGIHVYAGLEDRHLTLKACRIVLPAGAILFGGDVDLSKIFPEGFTGPMAGLDTLAYTFFLNPESLALDALELGENTPKGKVAARVRVQGQGVMPGQISARADLDVTVHDLILPRMSGPAKVQFKAGAELKKDHLKITGLTLDGPGMTGAGALRLNMPGFDPRTMTMTANLDLDVADISVPLSLVGQKASGSAGVHVAVKGALSAPDLTLDITAGNLSSNRFTADQVLCKARMDKGVLQVQDLTLKRRQGTLNARGTLALGGKKGREHALGLTVEFNRLELDDLVPDLGARGNFSGKVTGTGSLENPQIMVLLSGENPGFQTYALDNVQAQLKLVNNILTFEQARLRKNKAQLDITGQVNVADKTLDIRAVIPETDLKSIDPAADAALASGRLGMDISARGSLLAPDISGHITAVDLRLPNAPDMVANADAAIEVNGPLDNPDALQASVHISRLALAKQGQMLIVIENAAALLKDGRFKIDPVPVRIMDKGQLTLSAAGDIKGDLAAELSGSLPVSILVPLTDGINSAEGDLLISLQAKGNAASPDLKGSVEFSNVTLDLEALDEPLQKISGHILLTPDAVDILDVTANLGDGKITLAGHAELKNGMPDKFKLNLDAVQVPVDLPDTLEMTLNSQLTWAGTMDNSEITGPIDIFEGTYYKNVDLSLISIAAHTTQKSRPKVREPGPDFLKTIGLNIYVTRREAIAVDNNLATMTISPNLSVRGTLYAPSLDGRAVVDEGVINFQEAQFEITEGSIDFINPYKIEPEITLVSKTTISDYTITLSVSGTPDDLALNFSSDPDATDADILSLIAFGKTTEEIGADSDDGSMSTAVIAKMILDSLSEKIKDTTGLSDVSFSMDHEGDQTSVHVGFGADLSRQLSVSYGIDISDGGTVQTVTTYYKLLEHLLLSSFQDTSGKLGGELRYRLEFR
ncbi:translocation/assembly module TamB domain-containing protein [Desulfobacter postgatei]|uniref:translocation/assembly module TamB domain-containing protein n=1 Tax=Desulfobacter postgatei TaxID=2293 RepID=UPI002A35EB21|nr:translocation/assembly module TamB domain-containing protein [Desulfobacter postgatei]MDX9963249.1 translocation/assembly module TamB domain-containing protein [Desulfobacter postgatei]